MDVTLYNNVLEGTRQYFMGLPKASPSQAPSTGQPAWPATTQPPEEGVPAVSGAPTPNSRPPSTAAAPPSTPSTPSAPPRPPSEPLEPEPHIIHKATVMREALEKRRERAEPEDEGDVSAGTLSPPSHIIRKPLHALPSPCPSPARASSVGILKPPPAPTPPQPRAPTPRQHIDSQLEMSRASSDPAAYRHSYRTTTSTNSRPFDHYATSRSSDPYIGNRPAETVYQRYHYGDNSGECGRGGHMLSGSQQTMVHARHSPQQTYARLSGSMPQHAVTGRLRETTPLNPPSQRYNISAPPSIPHNDRVPPIHHPVPTAQRAVQPDSRTSQVYSSHHRPPSEATPYARIPPHHDRHPSTAPRKFESHQGYPGYRPAPVISQPIQPNHRVDTQHPTHLAYKHVVVDTPHHPPVHYPSRPPDRARPPDQIRPLDSARLPPRPEYHNISRPVEDATAHTVVRSNYQYTTPSTSSSRYGSTSVPVAQNSSITQRNTYRPPSVPKTNYDYVSPNNISQTSAIRPKPGLPNQQNRMTVSVTAIVNQMNRTKHKRESPLDLSVKTVKNSADSSTTQDDADSSVTESKNISLQHRPISNARQSSSTTPGYVSAHKVDFSPDFQSQYVERNVNMVHTSAVAPAQPSTRFNGSFDNRLPMVDSYPIDTRQTYVDDNKYNTGGIRQEYPVSRIDLTRSTADERHTDNRIRDDRHYIHDDSRKRIGGPIVNNIPEKIVRYEARYADSRLELMSRSAREQHELMSRPVYSYSSHKRLACQNEQKPTTATTSFRENVSNNRHPFITEHSHREPSDRHNNYLDRAPISNGRHVIQKVSRDVSHHLDHTGVPADKRVLSILRNSLETKQTGYVEPAKPARQIPDLIVIDDVDDSVIEITDLTKDNDSDIMMKNTTNPIRHVSPNISHNIHMPKAVDSISNDMDYQKIDNTENKGKSPEYDVASRIRTKAELKVMPPPQDNTRTNLKQENTIENSQIFNDKQKLLPKSQKQHLFNQIREDTLRLESVTKNDDQVMTEVKTEPLNIDEIERDAELSIKTEHLSDSEGRIIPSKNYDDLDWASACDNFVEQLKTGCHKKRMRRKRGETESENKIEKLSKTESSDQLECVLQPSTSIVIKQEPIGEDEIKITENHTGENLVSLKENESVIMDNIKTETIEEPSILEIKKEIEEKNLNNKSLNEESESTDDDEPLIKSKLLKEKEKNEQMKYKLLKELSEKSPYVKLEWFNVDLTNSNRGDSIVKDKERQNKGKSSKNLLKMKNKILHLENNKKDKIEAASSSDTDSDDVSVASRLRTRRKQADKIDESKSTSSNKSPLKSPSKKQDNISVSSTSFRKYGFGDGSDFHPGWEEELYRYKRSLRMPSRLIAIPRGRSGGPFGRIACGLLARGSTSLPDLDPVPLSPAPSSTPSAATDDFFARRQDKHILDSDLDSNSSCSAVNRLHYDSEASTSTIFSSNKTKDKRESIIDVLIQKYGKKEDGKKKNKDESKLKTAEKNVSDVLLTSGQSKKELKGRLNSKKEILVEDIFYLGAFKKGFNNTSADSTKSEGFTPVKLKTRTRTESRIPKQRATIKEVFGDERPASAPPTSCREEDAIDVDVVKKEVDSPKVKSKTKKIIKVKDKRRSSSIRDGLRSTKSLKRNDAKGRLLRLKKRNNLIKSLASKRVKDFSNKKKKSPTPEQKEKDAIKDDDGAPGPPEVNRKRFKRLFSRRKFSSGFDYIRKKKKIIRKEEPRNKIRRIANKPNPECEHDIHKEIKGWFINKSIGETPLHRAARLGYMDCIAYCLEKLGCDPSSRDNAGFTPLHVAASRGHVPIARLLLQYGANVSAAAQGGIRPLHEASENSHVEIIRLLLAYGADPLLGTYAGQTPAELAEGPASMLLRLHIADVQGQAVEPWQFPLPTEIIDWEEIGCDSLSSPPPASPPPPDSASIEIQCTDAPLPPFYSLRGSGGQPIDGLWCLLQDITSLLQIKSKDNLLKQIHCGSGSPKELLRELRTQEFLERAQCHQFQCAGEKVNVRASKVALVRVTDKLRQLLKIETVLIS